MKRPFILALTGTDGAGKSTLKLGLLAQLQGQGHRVCLIDKWDILKPNRFPECGFIKNDLKSLQIQISQMQGVSRALFLFWTMQVVMRAVGNDDSDIVILDGYWMKHAAAELVMGCSADMVHAIIEEFPRADMTIFLDVDPADALARKRGDLTPYECGCDQLSREQSFLAHQNKVRGKLRQWAETQQWLTLDSALGIAVVQQLALAAVELGLAKSGTAMTEANK